MNEPETTGLDALVAALARLPERLDALMPVYAALGQERPLTLRVIEQYSAMLEACTDEAREQTLAINRMIISCQQLPPIPLPCLPLDF